MVKLHELTLPKGSRRKRIRVGRGISAGKGKTCGRGTKGQKARTGGGVDPWFEGNRMPLYRQLPKRGFNNKKFAKEYVTINVNVLDRYFENGETVNIETLLERGVISWVGKNGLKILGDGNLTKKLKVEADKVSKSAKEKIEKAGGEVVIV